jgi:hypothetical protein
MATPDDDSVMTMDKLRRSIQQFHSRSPHTMGMPDPELMMFHPASFDELLRTPELGNLPMRDRGHDGKRSTLFGIPFLIDPAIPQGEVRFMRNADEPRRMPLPTYFRYEVDEADLPTPHIDSIPGLNLDPLVSSGTLLELFAEARRKLDRRDEADEPEKKKAINHKPKKRRRAINLG